MDRLTTVDKFRQRLTIQVDNMSTRDRQRSRWSTTVDKGRHGIDNGHATVDKSTNGAQPRYMGGKALKGMQGRQGGHGKLSARIITAGGRAGQLHPAWLCMEGEVPTGFDEDVCTAVLAAIHRV